MPTPLRTGRRGGLTVLVAAGLALCSALGLAACGTDTPTRPELVEVLQTSGVPEAQARCAATAILDSLTDEQVASIVERGSSGAPLDDPDRTDDAADKVRTALTACRTPEPAPDDGATTAPATSTTLPVEPSSTVSTRPESMQASTTSTTPGGSTSEP